MSKKLFAIFAAAYLVGSPALWASETSKGIKPWSIVGGAGLGAVGAVMVYAPFYDDGGGRFIYTEKVQNLMNFKTAPGMGFDQKAETEMTRNMANLFDGLKKKGRLNGLTLSAITRHRQPNAPTEGIAFVNSITPYLRLEAASSESSEVIAQRAAGKIRWAIFKSLDTMGAKANSLDHARIGVHRFYRGISKGALLCMGLGLGLLAFGGWKIYRGIQGAKY